MHATQRRAEATNVAKARLRQDIYKALTTARGATTAEARAKLFELHRANLSRIENGHAEPSLGVAMRMAHALGVGVETLWLRRGEVA